MCIIKFIRLKMKINFPKHPAVYLVYSAHLLRVCQIDLFAAYFTLAVFFFVFFTNYLGEHLKKPSPFAAFCVALRPVYGSLVYGIKPVLLNIIANNFYNLLRKSFLMCFQKLAQPSALWHPAPPLDWLTC